MHFLLLFITIIAIFHMVNFQEGTKFRCLVMFYRHVSDVITFVLYLLALLVTHSYIFVEPVWLRSFLECKVFWRSKENAYLRHTIALTDLSDTSSFVNYCSLIAVMLHGLISGYVVVVCNLAAVCGQHSGIGKAVLTFFVFVSQYTFLNKIYSSLWY